MTTPDEQLVGNLIDLSSENVPNIDATPDVDKRKSKSSVKFDDVFSDNSSGQNETKQYSRLCGYLNKLGNRAILKTFKKRWFVFCENNCKLYYYRTRNEPLPLGEIDISQATFTFDVHKERTGHFTISVPGRDYFLEASTRQAALYWLQELQKYRRTNSLLRTKHISGRSTNVDDLRGRPQSGLLAEVSSILNKEEEKDVSLMSPVCRPTDVIGEDSADGNNSPFTAAQTKLNVFYNQVKHTTNFVKNEKFSQDGTSNEMNSSKESIQEISSFGTKRESFDSESSPSHKSSKSPSLSAIRQKFSHSFRKTRVSDGEIEDLNTMDKTNCSKCRNHLLRIEKLEEEVSNLRDEVTTSQEVRTLLQRQLDIASKEKETLMQIYQLKNSDIPVDKLNEKDRQIVNLNHDIQEQKQEVEELQRQVLSLKTDVKELQSNNELFQEMMIQKDKTIMTLTNEVFELETDRQDESRRMSSASIISPEVVVEPKETMDMDDLKAAVDAFELQNKFLNNELLELNQLRRDAEERVRIVSVKCSEWEARSYQIQSKLLFLLNELNKSGSGQFNSDIVKQLLEEAVGDGTVHTNLLPSWSRDKRYDDLGFDWRWGKDDVLSLKASNLKQKSEDMANKKDPEIALWRAKWDNFIVTLGSKELQRSPELKILVRLGIPHEYKGKIWKGCVNMWIKDYKSMLGPDYYKSLLTSDHFVSRLDPSSKQIELDLLRTLPNNRHYENLDSYGIPKLRRVLLAYSRHNPVVGYCQGLNRLAAIALLFMDEEDAFWCLVAIIRFIMPDGYYTPTLIASHVDQKVLKDLTADKLPRLNTHLEQNNVDLSLFTFNWFLTVYVDNVPPETYLRIWDVFLYEGSKVLFRYALAFLKASENDILQIKDYLALNKHLRNIAEESTDIKKLTNIAFKELNPFPQSMINSRRTHHFQIIRAQLEELENERKQKKSGSEENIANVDYMSEED